MDLTQLDQTSTLVTMVAFGHTAIGALIGAYTYQYLGDANPAYGLLVAGSAGLISHYLFDSIPHGHFFREDQYQKKVGLVIVFDLAFSVIIYLLTAFTFSQANWLYVLYILYGIGGSQLPDILDGLIYTKRLPKTGILKWEFQFHNETHWHGKHQKALLWSIWDTWQVLLFFFGLYVLLTNYS